MALTFDFYRSATTQADPNWEIIRLVDSDSGDQFLSRGIILVNDSANQIQFAFPPADDTPDGSITLSGELEGGEDITFDARMVKRIALKSATGGDAYRLWAW